MSNKLIIPFFIPHLGCPHTCIFCNQKQITGTKLGVDAADISATVDRHLKTWRETDKPKEIAFYGGSFTAIDDEYQNQLLREASRIKEVGKIDEIRISTRPDYIDEKRIAKLLKYKVDTVELGVQSFSHEVLIKSERGHTAVDAINAVKMLKASGLQVGIQLMPGLPGDSEHRSLMSAWCAAHSGADFVRIYPTLVIKGTILAKMYLGGEYRPLDLEEAVAVSAQMLEVFKKYRVPVIRIGLQPTDGIAENAGIMAGPIHPAFGELVKSRLIRNLLSVIFAEEKLDGKELTVFCQGQLRSQFVGQKKENLIYLKERFNLKRLEFVEDKDLSASQIGIGIDTVDKAENHFFLTEYFLHGTNETEFIKSEGQICF